MDTRNQPSYYFLMTKVAISMDENLLQRLDRLVKTRPFRSRSQVVQEAVFENLNNKWPMKDWPRRLPHGPNIKRRHLLGRS